VGRRPQAAEVIAALADPDREWDALVVGEHERAMTTPGLSSKREVTRTSKRAAHAVLVRTRYLTVRRCCAGSDLVSYGSGSAGLERKCISPASARPRSE
jgi:hypothetical protein